MSAKNTESFGKVQMVKCIPTFMWTINNFCICHSKTGESIKSPIFSMGNNNQLKWRIHIYPKGFEKKYSDYVSIFLKLESSIVGEVKVKYKFSLLNNKKVRTNETGSDHSRLFTEGSDWGFREYILRDFLFDDTNGLLPDNKLTIYCDIEYRQASNIYEVAPIKSSDNEAKAFNDLEILLKDRKFCDVTFVVDDKKFYAHKAIMAARSPIFSNMFQNTNETQTSIIDVVNLDHNVLKEMIRFVYTGKIHNLQQIAINLLPAADQYVIEGLKTVCEEAIIKNLNFENAADILTIADRYKADNLKKETINFIISSGENVTNTEGFQVMLNSHPHLIAEAFQTVVSKFGPSDESSKKRKTCDSCS